MKFLSLATAVLGLAALSACVAPVGPVEVTRFHLEQTAMLAQGTVAVEPGVRQDAASLEFRSYAGAVSRELTRLGYSEMVAGTNRSDQVAIVSVERYSRQESRDDKPVSVGLAGGTGSYGSAVGVGVGVNLSSPPPPEIVTKLSVTIRDRASGQTVWEGRASFSVRPDSPLADTQLGAARLAEALFRDFPGQSGATILVE